MNRILHIITLSALTLAFAGCQTAPAPHAGRGDPYPAPLNDPQITVLPPDLIDQIVFHPAAVTGGAGAQPMEVQVPMRNLTDRRYLLDYRMLFFDDAGLEVDPTMGWRTVPLGPGQVVRLKANAMDTRPVGYRVEVTWAQ